MNKLALNNKHGLGFWMSFSIGISLIILGSIALLLQMYEQKDLLMRQEQKRAETAARMILSSLESLMLAGNIHLVKDWLERIRRDPEIKIVQILRNDGYEALHDLDTVNKVNDFIGTQRFSRESTPLTRPKDIDPVALVKAVAGQHVDISEITQGQFTHLLPITLSEPCRSCHGYIQDNVIGILRLTTDFQEIRKRIEKALYRNLIADILTLSIFTLGLYLLIYYRIIKPINELSIAVKRITIGDVDTRIPVIYQDELGMLAMAMNEMAIGLRRTMVSRKFVSSIMDSMLNALFVIDQEGLIRAVNPAACSLLGYSEQELLGQTFKKILSVDSVTDQICLGLEHKGKVHEVERRFIDRNGSSIPVLMSSSPILGLPGSRVCVAQNLSEYKRMEHALLLSHNSLREVVMKHHTGIIVADTAGKVLFANHAASSLLGQNIDSLSSSTLDLTTVQRKKEIDIIRPHKQRGVARLHITEIDWEGQRGSLLMLDDVTDRKITEEAMLHMVYHDALTGLPNRMLFLDKLTQALTRANLSETIVAILFLDLDRFKTINDSLGHNLGDQLLQETSARLQDVVRKDDTVARMGSDEFTLILECLKTNAVIEVIAQKILRIFSAPFYLQEHVMYITASIGISLFPKDGSDPEVLLKYADTAMHYAKEQGLNQICLYRPDLSSQLTNKLDTERQLREALENEQFLLFYQPQIDLKTNELIGLEALLRWQHPIKGVISIGPFIPLLENIGLIGAVGNWVLNTACRQLDKWQQAGLVPVQTSVNLSAAQLRECNIVATVEKSLAENKVNPELLGLELTESMIMTNMNEALTILRTFAELGIGLSIDDFGTGYSSLSVLRQLPMQVVKLDCSFVQEVTNHQQDAALVSAVIAMAHRLGKQVVAEGVETEEQQEFLKGENCDYGQGYLYGRPMPAEQIATLLQRK